MIELHVYRELEICLELKEFAKGLKVCVYNRQKY